MRWIVFLPLAYACVVVQTSLGLVLRVPVTSAGMELSVDFLAALAVTVALRVRGGADAMLAAWSLGLALDLATGGSPVGLYALAFALAGGAAYQIRQAVFSDHPLSQIVVGLLFVLLAHGLRVLFMNLYVRPESVLLGPELAQMLAVGLCTALVTPLVARLVRPLERLMLVQPPTRR